MKTSTLVCTIVASSMLSAAATSALWLVADGLRSPQIILSRPSPPASVAAMPVTGSPTATATATPTAPAAATAASVAVQPTVAGSASPRLPEASVLPDDAESPMPEAVAPPAPAMPGATTSAPVAAVAPDPAAAPAPAAAPQPEPDTAAVAAVAPAGGATTEQGEPVGAEAGDGPTEPAVEIAYRDTYITCLGYDTVQLRTIPWYCQHFHLPEEQVLCVCFIARAAQVPFGTAIVTYVESCGSSVQALLAYYHLSAQIFLIVPGTDLHFPPGYERPYRWLREGAREPAAFTNQEYEDLLALKLSTDYLGAAPQDFLAAAQAGAPLRMMRGLPVRHAPAAAPGASAPVAHEAPPAEESLVPTEALKVPRAPVATGFATTPVPTMGEHSVSGPVVAPHASGQGLVTATPMAPGAAASAPGH